MAKRATKPEAIAPASNTPAPPAPLNKAQIEAYLDYAFAEMQARRDELIAALEQSFKAHPIITEDKVLGDIAENIRMARALSKTAEDKRKDVKEPFLSGGRTVDAWVKGWAAPIDAAIQPLQAAMNAYGEEKERLAREEARKAREAAERAAEEAARAAAEALKANDAKATDEALDRAVDADAQAEEARKAAEVSSADLTRTYGTYGAVTSGRRTWGWEVTDFNAVPREYLMINEDVVRAKAKERDASGKPTAVIPGIQWVSSFKMGVR